MPWTLNPFTGTLDKIGSGPPGPPGPPGKTGPMGPPGMDDGGGGGDGEAWPMLPDLSQYLYLPGRSGAANNPLLSLDDDGAIFGSALATGSLELNPNPGPSMAGGYALNIAPAITDITTAALVLVVTGEAIVRVLHGDASAGLIVLESTDNLTLAGDGAGTYGEFIGLNYGPTIAAASAPSSISRVDGVRITTNLIVNGTSVTVAEAIGVTVSPTFNAIGGGSLDLPFRVDLDLGASYSNAVHAANITGILYEPSVVGGAVIDQAIALDIIDLAPVTADPLSVRSVGPTTVMRHAGALHLGDATHHGLVTGPTTAGLGLGLDPVEGTTLAAGDEIALGPSITTIAPVVDDTHYARLLTVNQDLTIDTAAQVGALQLITVGSRSLSATADATWDVTGANGLLAAFVLSFTPNIRSEVGVNQELCGFAPLFFAQPRFLARGGACTAADVAEGIRMVIGGPEFHGTAGGTLAVGRIGGVRWVPSGDAASVTVDENIGYEHIQVIDKAFNTVVPTRVDVALYCGLGDNDAIPDSGIFSVWDRLGRTLRHRGPGVFGADANPTSSEAMLEVVASDPFPSAFLLSRLSGVGEGAFVAPVGGMLIFRTDTQVVRLYNGATWVDIGSGSPGPQGPPGIPGLDGADGEDGLMGPMGPVGATGATGATGAIGPMGFPGLDGDEGEQGSPIPGPIGLTGATGPTGATGAQGLMGFPGLDGDMGDEGFAIPGPVGPTGATGATGTIGPIGPPGLQGDDPDDVWPLPMPTTTPLSTFLGSDVSTVTVVNSAAETSVFTVTIPGGTLGIQNGVRTTVYGTYLKNAAGSIRIRAKYGGTTICDTGAGTIAPGASATVEQFMFVFDLFAGGATGTQKGVLDFESSLKAGNFGLVGTNVDYGTGAVNSLADQTLDITVEWSTNSLSLSFSKEVAICERVSGVVGAQGIPGATGAQGPIGPAIPLLEDVSVEDVMRLGSPTLTVADIPALPTSKITSGTFDHHSQLTNFTANDDHTQYAFLNGRSGGQTFTGDTSPGGTLTLQSTAHATKGTIQLASSTLAFVEASGLASIYANMSTAGVGLATVLGVADPGIQSSGVSNSSIVSPPANGLYKVSVYVEVTTGAGTATVAVSIKYNDDSATAQTLSGFSGLSLTTTGNHNMSVFFVRALTTAAIQYSVTVTGTQGLARYRPFAVVERVA